MLIFWTFIFDETIAHARFYDMIVKFEKNVQQTISWKYKSVTVIQNRRVGRIE